MTCVVQNKTAISIYHYRMYLLLLLMLTRGFAVFCVYCVIIVFFSANCVIYVCLQYFDTVGLVLRPVKNCRPYNLYCVGGDVKPCSINQSVVDAQLW